MRLRVSSVGVELGREERERIDRTVRVALGRHAVLIARAHVSVRPSPRMQGADRRCCRIRVRRRDGRSLVAEEHARDVCEAALGATVRLEGRLDLERAALRR